MSQEANAPPRPVTSTRVGSAKPKRPPKENKTGTLRRTKKSRKSDEQGGDVGSLQTKDKIARLIIDAEAGAEIGEKNQAELEALVFRERDTPVGQAFISFVEEFKVRACLEFYVRVSNLKSLEPKDVKKDHNAKQIMADFFSTKRKKYQFDFSESATKSAEKGDFTRAMSQVTYILQGLVSEFYQSDAYKTADGKQHKLDEVESDGKSEKSFEVAEEKPAPTHIARELSGERAERLAALKREVSVNFGTRERLQKFLVD